MVTKMYRAYSLFASPSSRALKRKKFSNTFTFLIILLLLLVDVTILALWQYFDPPVSTVTYDELSNLVKIPKTSCMPDENIWR